MPAERLRVVEGRAVGSYVPLEHDELRIGRAESGIGKLDDDPEISRSHARVSRAADGALNVEDLGSKNGTFVNGDRIEGARRLQPGDRIRLGSTTLEVSEIDQGVQPTAMSAQPPRPAAAAPAAGLRQVIVAPRSRRRRSSRPALLAVGALVVAVIAVVAILVLIG